MVFDTKQLSRVVYCLILLLMLIPGIVSAQLNTNGGFESSAVDTVSGTNVEGWVIELGGTADAVFEIVDDTVQNGSRAMKITINTIGSNAWDIQVVGDSIPVQQGETYHYSVWAKSSVSSQVTFTVGNYSLDEYGGVIRPSSPNVTTEWQEYAFDFTVTDEVEYIRAPIHFSYTANVGDTIYIDNLRIYNPEDLLKPVVIEAESGSRGSEFDSLSEEGVEYISITTDYDATTGTLGYPGANRTVTYYQVTFPDTGIYDLFVRLRVGDEGFDDDSFFYGNGFGEKAVSLADDWIIVNQMNEAGFNEPDAVVHGPGILGNGVWKWVNISVNQYTGEPPLQFTIGSADSLTRIFQIGGRENGLDIDKFVFGKSYLNFTVDNLDKGEPGSIGQPEPVWEGPPLASGQPKFVGNVYSPAQIENFELYWNQVTPENAGKWGSVEGTRDVMNWSGLDAAYALAKDNDFPFNFHVLIWGAQQPAWIDTLEPAEQLEEIEEWFQAVADRYPEIDYLQVTNEMLPNHQPPDGQNGRANYIAALGGNGDTGWDWVINAFKMAHDIFPASTKLMINDYNIINSNSNTAQIINLINLLKAEDLIDAVGDQGHAGQTDAPLVTMLNNLDALAATGIPIQITEFDIRGPSDAIQLQNYARLFSAFYEHPGVEGITLWGWRAPMYIEDGYIINQDGSERPALEWLRTYLDSVDVTSIEGFSELPIEFHLSNNYPNPFNPSTTITFALPKNSKVKLSVFNILGQEVAVVLNENVNAGNHEIKFNGSDLSSGLYFYKLVAGEFVRVKKMMLIK